MYATIIFRQTHPAIRTMNCIAFMNPVDTGNDSSLQRLKQKENNCLLEFELWPGDQI